MGKELVKDIIHRYGADSGMLIPMLQDMQAEFGYLPADQLKTLARQLEIPLSRIYSVATFYASFRMAPKGAHEVTLCMGTVCYLKGADKISETICREFNVTPGGTTPDRLFSFQPVNCVGACALAPVMIIDGEYHDGVSAEKAVQLLNRLAAEGEEDTADKKPPTKKEKEGGKPSMKNGSAKLKAGSVKPKAKPAVQAKSHRVVSKKAKESSK
jgi:NADH-quinone oxidoreductase subunit E